ncbi:Tigger transposable element-derived protein 7-like 9 [Homarus americanus]|uniref:Tigger transposable element-derived protein 7-like 8 n=1 Tax=Homarus americanus TaxID=6706 RepID=A0A8J5NEZ3_HOMAM|nr:Tigger transposable element-derived protein 7-like 8 [Homarus americanus]KAG7178297.1 Tigger transposable element-derived protein 7-like 9 [Homarus americanus]
MSSRGSKTPKRKYVTLSVNQKLELIRKLEAGASVSRDCDEYGVKKQTVSDIRKAKDKLIAFSLKYNVDATSKSSSVGARKRMRVAKDTNLEEAVTKWFVQQRSCGNVVRGVEIRAAAVKLASNMGIENFEASDGWLWRFRNRHGMCNRITHGEAGSAPTEDIEPFRDRLNDLIKSEGLLISQVYYVDETGLYWRSLPRNTQDFKNKASSPGRKVNEEEDLTEDTRGQRTVNNVKNYNLKSAIFNLAASWKALKTTTLANAWKKLLYNVEVEYDFEGFEARDFHHILKRAGKNDVTEDDIRNWLEDTEGDPGYQVLTEEDIADEVLVRDSRDSEDEEDEEPLPKKPKLSVIRESLDNVISYIELSAETDDIQHYYQHIRALRELIIQRQHHQGKQLKLDSFFKPVRPNPAAAVEPAADSGHPQSPQPSTSGGQGPVEHHSSTDSE